MWFKSFREDYHDPMEPDDYGFCLNPDGKCHFNEGAGRDEVCDQYKPAYDDV